MAPEIAAARPATIRLLLVEDDDGDALLVEELLATTGARMELVRAQTLSEARAEDLATVDCVLLDLDLPDAQGLAALRRLKGDRRELAVLVLTGLDDEQRGIEAVAAGAQDYLVKGQIDRAGLARAVRYATSPDAAALGVCLRIAWRALVLGGRAPDALLPTLQLVHGHERHFAWMFTTLCMVTIAPDRRSVAVRRAGHPAPLLVSETGIANLEDGPVAPPLGVLDDARWAAHAHPLPEPWSLLLYTDGLIEGRTGPGPERLGEDGLAAMVRHELAHGQDGLVAALVERAEELNGGPLLDDVAALLVQWRAG